MKLKKVLFIPLIAFFLFLITGLCVFFLFFCSSDEKKVKQAHATFSRFENKNEIAIEINANVYFSSYELDVRNLNIQGEIAGDIATFQNEIYFSSCEQSVGCISDFSLRIYKCDYEGNNLVEIFKRDGYNKYPWARYSNCTPEQIYIVTRQNAFSEKATIDAFNLENGEYVNVSSATTFYDYENGLQSSFSWENDQHNISVCIGENTYSFNGNDILQSEEGKALANYAYELDDVEFLNSRIFVFYKVYLSQIEHLYVCFEFDTENEKLSYHSYYIVNNYDFAVALRYLY